MCNNFRVYIVFVFVFVGFQYCGIGGRGRYKRAVAGFETAIGDKWLSTRRDAILVTRRAAAASAVKCAWR